MFLGPCTHSVDSFEWDPWKATKSTEYKNTLQILLKFYWGPSLSHTYTHTAETHLHIQDIVNNKSVSTAVHVCLGHVDLEASKNGIGESYSDFILTFGENSVAISTAHKGLHKFFFLPQVSQGFSFLYTFLMEDLWSGYCHRLSHHQETVTVASVAEDSILHILQVSNLQVWKCLSLPGDLC